MHNQHNSASARQHELFHSFLKKTYQVMRQSELKELLDAIAGITVLDFWILILFLFFLNKTIALFNESYSQLYFRLHEFERKNFELGKTKSGWHQGFEEFLITWQFSVLANVYIAYEVVCNDEKRKCMKASPFQFLCVKENECIF